MEMMNEDVPIKKLHWMDVCIICDKGGKLLTCLENGCPMVVHEDCLGCEAQFDEMGNFCCPYCVYKRAIQDLSQAERKAVLAEKSLSRYLDGKGVGNEGFVAVNVTGRSDVRNECVDLEKDCHEAIGPGCVMREKEADVLLVNKESDVVLTSDDIIRVKVVGTQNELECVVRGRGDECWSGEGKVDQQKDVDMNERRQSGDKLQNDAIQIEIFPKHQQDAERFEACKIMKENEGRVDEVQNPEQAHETTVKNLCKESATKVNMKINKKVDDTTAFTCMDTNTISEKVTGAQPLCVNFPRRSPRKNKYVHIEKSSTPCKSSKVAKPPTIFTTLPTVKDKRERLAWKVEEEEMLKKGVQKYSKKVNKNLPWQKILEEGRVVFDDTRTPADLKDKWRNILLKEPLFELS